METGFSDWLQNNQALAIWLIPFFAFAESCVGLGIFVSGAFLVIVCTFVVEGDLASIYLCSVLALLGATLGDHVGYYTGRWIGPRFHHSQFAQRNQQRLTKAESLIARHGGAAVFIGRFFPAIRSIIPPLLGISGFRQPLYSLLDLSACLLWSIALGLIVVGLESLF